MERLADRGPTYLRRSIHTVTDMNAHAIDAPRLWLAAVALLGVIAGRPGLVPPPYSSRNHDGYTGAQIGTIQNGSLVLSGPACVTVPNGSVTSRAVTVSTPRLTS